MNLGGVVRVGVDLLACERVSCEVSVRCDAACGVHAGSVPETVVGGCVVAEPELVLVVVELVVVIVLVRVVLEGPDGVPFEVDLLVLAAVVVVVLKVVDAVPGWHWE